MKRSAYGLVSAKIVEIMAQDEQLTIEQLHIITGEKKDSIIKAVRRKHFMLTKVTQKGKRGYHIRVCSCANDASMNNFLLKGILKHGS